MSQLYRLLCIVFLDSHIFHQISDSAGSVVFWGIFLCEWREAICALGWLGSRLPCEMPTNVLDSFLCCTSPLSSLPPQKLSDPQEEKTKSCFFFGKMYVFPCSCCISSCGEGLDMRSVYFYTHHYPLDTFIT